MGDNPLSTVVLPQFRLAGGAALRITCCLLLFFHSRITHCLLLFSHSSDWRFGGMGAAGRRTARGGHPETGAEEAGHRRHRTGHRLVTEGSRDAEQRVEDTLRQALKRLATDATERVTG